MTPHEIDELSRRVPYWIYTSDAEIDGGYDGGNLFDEDEDLYRTFWQLVALSEGLYRG